MRYYENWLVTDPNGDKEFVGSFSKMLEHYNMTKEQCFEMMKNDTFPYGKISKQKKYYDYNLLTEDMSKMKGTSKFYHVFKQLMYDILSTEKDYPINDDTIQFYFNLFDAKLCETIIKVITGNTVKNCKVLVKECEYYSIYDNEKRTQKLLCVALPKDIGYSFVFKIYDNWLCEGRNHAYDLYKQIVFECVRSINKCKICPELKGRVCYLDLYYKVKVIDMFTGSVVEPEREGYTTRYYLNELNPDYYKQSTIYII